MKSIIILSSAIIAYTTLVFLSGLLYVQKTTFEPDYYLELNKEHFYIIDSKSNDTIYSEKVNWENPTKFQKILIQDNL